MMENYKKLFAKVKAFVFDVDGVLTDGSVLVMPDGEFLRSYNTKDGYAMQLAHKAGFYIAIITRAKSETIRKRMNGIGLSDVYIGQDQKNEAFENFLKKYSLSPADVLYMGDDLPDITGLKMSALPCCPKDASNDVKANVMYISDKDGGKGCVRDVIEQVMKVQGKWPL